LLVRVQVEVPRKLTKKQEELVRELAALDQQHSVKTHHKSFFEKLWDFLGPKDDEGSGASGK
jgi:molecular chaperone DnaJ